MRWYVRYRLSYADVVEWFAERGLVVNRSTVYRWVRRFLPLFGEAARVHRRQVGGKWLGRHMSVSKVAGPMSREHGTQSFLLSAPLDQVVNNLLRIVGNLHR